MESETNNPDEHCQWPVGTCVLWERAVRQTEDAIIKALGEKGMTDAIAVIENGRRESLL